MANNISPNSDTPLQQEAANDSDAVSKCKKRSIVDMSPDERKKPRTEEAIGEGNNDLPANISDNSIVPNVGGNDRTFYVLDELAPSDEEEESNFDSDCTLSDSEVHDMLEKGMMKDKAKSTAEPKPDGEDGDAEAVGGDGDENEAQVRKLKTVLVEKNQNHFEILPDGWIAVAHQSGMPVYLHRPTRVCTFSKPYFLGTGSCRNHKIPLSAIPCLDYKRALQAEKDRPESLVVNGTTLPHARVETAQENDEARQLAPEEFYNYCKSLFEFREIEVVRFNTWPARRKFYRQRRKEQRPTLPKDSKLIMCPIRSKDGSAPSRSTKEWIMNPYGKTYVCILHDYVQRALRERPVYTFKELENTATPYLVVISINGIDYGKGIGSSKKIAKMEAAKATLDILIPGMKDKIVEHPRIAGRAGDTRQDTDLSFFDDIKIEDPRVVEFCMKTTEPLPHAILLSCLQRNYGLSETNITYEMKPIRHAKSLFTITVGSNSATVECQNKRDGKQRASQALLQILHPHIWSWGSLLRLYGNTSVKSFKEKKVEEQEITALQNKGVTHKPNYAIITKLREEMLKLLQVQREVQPIGIFVPPEDVKLPSTSTSDLNNLTL